MAFSCEEQVKQTGKILGRRPNSGTISAFGGREMEERDFSKPAQPKPQPAAPAPKQVYNAAMALEFFRAGGKPESASPGTTFFEENEKAGFLKRDKMYLLMEGEVTLVAKGRVIGVVKAGEIFGEMAAISESPRSATAVAKTESRVIALDDNEFLKALAVKPEFALLLMGMMILRLRAMIARLAHNPPPPPAAPHQSPPCN